MRLQCPAKRITNRFTRTIVSRVPDSRKTVPTESYVVGIMSSHPLLGNGGISRSTHVQLDELVSQSSVRFHTLCSRTTTYYHVVSCRVADSTEQRSVRNKLRNNTSTLRLNICMYTKTAAVHGGGGKVHADVRVRSRIHDCLPACLPACISAITSNSELPGRAKLCPRRSGTRFLFMFLFLQIQKLFDRK